MMERDLTLGGMMFHFNIQLKNPDTIMCNFSRSQCSLVLSLNLLLFVTLTFLLGKVSDTCQILYAVNDSAVSNTILSLCIAVPLSPNFSLKKNWMFSLG